MPGLDLGLDVPVCLAGSAPFKVQTKQLVFYDVIDVNITSKSSVLACIAESGGEARLPDAISLSDFKQWMSAVDGTSKDVRKESFSFICTVAKVSISSDSDCNGSALTCLQTVNRRWHVPNLMLRCQHDTAQIVIQTSRGVGSGCFGRRGRRGLDTARCRQPRPARASAWQLEGRRSRR